MTRRTAIILATITALTPLDIVVAIVMPSGSPADPLPLDTIALSPGFEMTSTPRTSPGRDR